MVKEFFKIIYFWTSSHPIAGSEVSGPENGKQNLFESKWCVLIKDKKTNLKHLVFLSLFGRRWVIK